MAGGIPIPTGRLACMRKFKDAMEAVLASNKWVHFYPEGSMWFYYPDIRPLKKAVFQYAVKYDRPVLPLAFSFRPRNKFQRLFGRAPLVDLTVGVPIRHDATLSRGTATAELQERTYHILDVQESMLRSSEQEGAFVEVVSTCERSKPLALPVDGEESSLI